MAFDANILTLREPLLEYPWYGEVDDLLAWVKDKGPEYKAFCFDLVMSLAYIDSTSGLEKYIESCKNAPQPYNAHLGFINLCSPCYEKSDKWTYQKAAKPQSGALGKLSSEVILRFIKGTSDHLTKVYAVGGSGSIDAVLYHSDGTTILAEVKSAPLITYPVLFKCNIDEGLSNHSKVVITGSQLRTCDSALYMHNMQVIPLGSVGGKLWPFKGAISFVTNVKNKAAIDSCVQTWIKAKEAYVAKDRGEKIYYLANASGSPPSEAVKAHGWPKSESVSDGKTSAGMDRTDDIKKGIYQAIKMGTELGPDQSHKTAIISNLPAYRHGDVYVTPFNDIVWGTEDKITSIGKVEAIERKHLRNVFDYLITLDTSILRGKQL